MVTTSSKVRGNRGPNRRWAPRGWTQQIGLIILIWGCADGFEGPRTFSAAHSDLSISAATVPSGSSANVTLRLRDAAGRALHTGGATVEFALGPGTSEGEFGSTVDHADGSYSTTFTATIAGTARPVLAIVNGVTVASPSLTIITVHGPPSATRSVVELSSATVQSGDVATLILRVRDSAGNAHTSGGLAVTFTKGAGSSDGVIANVTPGSDGTYTASYSATIAGTPRTIGATIDGVSLATELPAIVTTIGPPSPATSTVEVSRSTIRVCEGSTLTLRVRDAAGNQYTSGGLTVVFTKTAQDGFFSGFTDHNEGTYTTSFTATISSIQSVSATIDGVPLTSPAPTITVLPYVEPFDAPVAPRVEALREARGRYALLRPTT